MIMIWQLFTKPKDEVSLLLIGTEITDNDLNEELGGYEHISTGFPMEATNWKMIKYVEKSIDPPSDSITADWLDGIVVAMNYLKSLKYGFCAPLTTNITNNCVIFSCAKSNLKIILLTTFSTRVLDDSMESVAAGLKEMNIELIAM